MNEMLSYRNIYVLFAGIWLAGTAYGQAITTPPPGTPAVPPVWGTPPPLGTPAMPGVAPAPGVAPLPQDDSFFVPVQPNSGFDYFEDEEDPYGGGGGSGKGTAEGKESFKLMSRPAEDVCKEWGNSLLGSIKFKERSTCELELEREVQKGYSSIDSLTDKFELDKLHKVIKGELRDRAAAKKYSVSYTALRQSLQEAAKAGCACQKR